MARRRRRGFRGFGALNLNMLKESTEGLDVLLGAVAGIAGIYAVRFAIKKLNVRLPAFVTKVTPLLGCAVAGGLLFAVQRKKNRRRAVGHLVGALAAGAAMQVKVFSDGMPFIAQNQLSDYSDVVELQGIEDDPALGSAETLNLLNAIPEEMGDVEELLA